jgi:hypothetical protein
MKLPTVKRKNLDLIGCFRGCSTRVKIKDFQGPKRFFFGDFTNRRAVSLKKYPTA